MATQYTIQRLARIGRETCWYDVSESFEFLPSAEAALIRFREDCPREDFRVQEYGPPKKPRTKKPPSHKDVIMGVAAVVGWNSKWEPAEKQRRSVRAFDLLVQAVNLLPG